MNFTLFNTPPPPLNTEMKLPKQVCLWLFSTMRKKSNLLMSKRKTQLTDKYLLY